MDLKKASSHNQDFGNCKDVNFKFKKCIWGVAHKDYYESLHFGIAFGRGVSYLATEHKFYITSCHLTISFYHAKRKQKKRKQITKVSTPNTSSPLPVQS